jgi:small subunit ribosomal protein S17
MAATRGRRVTVVGTVVSDKMDKTITVREDRLVRHPMYGKYQRRGTTYKAHDERNEAHEGDQVEIRYARPLSKSKRWRLVRVLRRGPGAEEVAS